MPALISLVPAAIGIAQSISAKDKENEAEAKAAELEANRPKLLRDPNADANLALLKSDLANGISARTEQAYEDSIDRNQSTSLSALLRGGGDVNEIGEIYGGAQDGRMKLAMLKENMRMNQIKNVLDQSEKVDERNVVSPFQVNEFAPYSDKVAATGEARMAADQRFWQGINTIGSSIMQSGQIWHEENMNKNKDDDDFKTNYGKGGQWRKARRYARRNDQSFDQYNDEYNNNLSVLSRILR